jgi:hypothetical protein
MEHWLNDTERRNQIVGRKTYPSVPLGSTNFTWTELGLNLGLHGDRLVTNQPV